MYIITQHMQVTLKGKAVNWRQALWAAVQLEPVVTEGGSRCPKKEDRAGQEQRTRVDTQAKSTRAWSPATCVMLPVPGGVVPFRAGHRRTGTAWVPPTQGGVWVLRAPGKAYLTESAASHPSQLRLELLTHTHDLLFLVLQKRL